MNEFAIFVAIKAKPGLRDAVVTLITENAGGARVDEPGCRVFDVLICSEDPDTLYAYEIYDDEAAFKAHQCSPHFEKWREASDDMIADRDVVRAGRVF